MDLISDLLTRIRNGQRANLNIVKAPSSKLSKMVLDVLCAEGYIDSYNTDKSGNIENISVKLKYSSGKPVINKISRVSKPGKRVYSSIKDLGKYYNGLGTLILSTSKGVMSDYNASLQNVGGEVLCIIY